MKIVIRAGGVGSRLWPVSRNAQPKQFHALTSDRTMLQEAFDRCEGLVEPSDVYVSGNEATQQLIQEQLPEVSSAHIIVEPARRDTAAAIGLESVIIAAENPEAIVASLGSDHAIKKSAEFRSVLKSAEAFVQAHPEYIMPIGLQPLRPETGYGYIQYSDVLEKNAHTVYAVNTFTEKPDRATAKEFIKDGHYLWNGNMFVWRVDTILNLYKEFMPDMYAGLMEIQAAVGTPEFSEVVNRVYPQFEKLAVDYAIIEKTKKIATIPAHIGWNDVGDWSRLKDELAESDKDNVVIGGSDHTDVDSTNTLVYAGGKKKVVTIGVKNAVIVDTGDVLFVADKYRADEVKHIVEKLEEEGNSELL